jgi:diguanylate cyclase (GGDEF)-like protein
MDPIAPDTAQQLAAPAQATPVRLNGGWRLGIASRLALGFAAVAAVFVAGHILAARTTRAAVDAVERMQIDHEPLARKANGVVANLAAYDRAVGDYLQTGRTSGFATIAGAADTLDATVASYFASPATENVNGGPIPGAALRPHIASHTEHGRSLARHAAQRAEWAEQRYAALDRVQQRIASAGGMGVAISGTQVVATRSLAELATAINAVRVNLNSPTIGKREQAFAAVLQSNTPELQHSPGRTWLELEHEDFVKAVHLRQALEKFDATGESARREFLEESEALMAAVQEQLQEPTRRGMLSAAAAAATAAAAAEQTLTMTGFAVLAVLVLVSLLLVISISVPVKRLTAATRRQAAGDRNARAPRGGSAEIDALAGSFNTMAEQIERAEGELRAQQAQLERHVAERTSQLHHLAHHDPLTQLPNRRQLAARLTGALARAASRDERVALLFVDVDNFKSINDTLGHNFGDRVLQAIAERLGMGGEERVLLARLGGDEFTMLIENVSCLEEVQERAAQIVATLQQPLMIDGRQLAVTASVGASLFPDHATDAEHLLRSADVALFRAKELGRNRYALYQPALYDAAAQRFGLEQALRRAVEAGELLLMFQPQVSLHNFELIGLEALLRWRKPDGQFVPAAEFIHIAEKTGLIHELTDWVLRHATQTAAAWRKQGWQHPPIAVNVSPPQFFERDFVEHIARSLQAAGLPASALELELTETVLQTGSNTVDSLRRLRDLGVSIALDDFGIGYSSLTSLEQLPITRVKLDRMLVASVDSNPRSAAIVRSIIALCHGLGLQVIAEGVERNSQLEFLSRCGPIGVQGYLLARPVEAHHAHSESRAAVDRARQALEAVAQASLESTDHGLVFVGKGGRRRG